MIGTSIHTLYVPVSEVSDEKAEVSPEQNTNSIIFQVDRQLDVLILSMEMVFTTE